MSKSLFHILLSLLLLPAVASAQEREITGTVTDAVTGEPLIGATVLIRGTQQGTITDVNGEYTISAGSGDVLVFSYVGYLEEEVAVGDQTTINVQLNEDTQSLEEVVVVGYGKVKKSDLTGSVSSVRGEDLTKIPSVSPEQALQGKVAGVRVTSSSGEPGESPTVRIRGVGTFGNPSPIYVVDGVILNDISFLNSSDILSMEVLKDASATAMYGSRGANGVIIITTKSGSFNDKPQIDIRANYEIQTIQHYIDMMEAREFARAVNTFMPGTFNNLSLLENTDWQQEVYKDYAPIQNYQLAVTGGSEKTRYYASVGYFDQEGIIPTSAYERISIKVNNEYRLHDHISLGHNLTFTNFRRDIADNIVASTLRAWPTDPVYAEDGSFYGNRGNGNPVAALEYGENTRKGIRTVGNFFAEIEFLKNFKFRSSFGLDLEYSDYEGFTPVFYVTPQQNNDESSLNKSRYSQQNWLWENTLNYNLETDNHSIDVLAGYTAQEDNNETIGGSGKNLLRDDIRYLDNSLDDIQISNAAGVRSMVSYLFRLNYVFQNKYLITATYRRDGSSAFAEDIRWGDFPSFAVGWRISQEDFFNVDPVSNLKLRASWGIVGNDKVDVFRRYTLIRNDLSAVFGPGEILYAGSSFDQSGNPDLLWEEAKQTDIGLELGMFSNRLNIEMDFYNKITEGILIPLALPGHTGNGAFSRTYFNAADVLNRGFELSIGWKDNLGDLYYEVNVVGSTVHNEALKMGETTGATNFLLMGALGNGQNVKRVVKGQPIGYFYGYEVAGVFQNAEELEMYPHLPLQGVGDFRYVDVNDDGTISPEDRTFIGSPIPDYLYGFNITLDYKGFNLSLDFQGEEGRQIYDGKDAIRAGIYNYQEDYTGAWDGEGSTNEIPRITAGGPNYSQSSWFVEDGSFFRLRNVTLGYEIPASVAENLNLVSASVFIRGTNVFTLTDYSGYTPEIGGSVEMNGIDMGVYPVTSVYGIGFNLTF